ncbi:hypothetical protein NL108_016356 [Boleophthalmus pectinirostris]|nr:hypothetical protein NL108_016356 [Boleophthalmus pectinirostris]
MFRSVARTSGLWLPLAFVQRFSSLVCDKTKATTRHFSDLPSAVSMETLCWNVPQSGIKLNQPTFVQLRLFLYRESEKCDVTSQVKRFVKKKKKKKAQIFTESSETDEDLVCDVLFFFRII